MLFRALALLVFLVGVSLGLSWWFGVDVLAALGAILAQARLLAVRAVSAGGGPALAWLRAQGINFARIELGKRWFLRSLLPLILGAALYKRLRSGLRAFAIAFRARRDRMTAWYRGLGPGGRVVVVVVACGALLALAVSSVSLWLVFFSVQVPIWLVAVFGTAWQFLWRWAQKLAFRTIAFLHLAQLWRFLHRRLPEGYHRRKRRLDYRLARAVVRRRRMTVAQLHEGRHSLRMRMALLRERLRRAPARPRAPEKETPAE